jgi:hypothetical protein
MLSYITVGANDVPRSGRFYAAILTPLGYEKKEAANAVEFTSPDVPGRVNGPGAVYVKKPYDGKEATVGNGSPGFRDEYSDRFYVGYLRDPLGNKVAIFCANPAEGTRGR